MKLNNLIQTICENEKVDYKDFVTSLSTFYKIGIAKAILIEDYKINYDRAYLELMDNWNKGNDKVTLYNTAIYTDIINVVKDREKALTVSSLNSTNYNLLEGNMTLIYKISSYIDNFIREHPIEGDPYCKIPSTLQNFIQKFVEARFYEDFNKTLRQTQECPWLYKEIKKYMFTEIKQQLRDKYDASIADINFNLNRFSISHVFWTLRQKYSREQFYAYFNTSTKELNKEFIKQFTEEIKKIISIYLAEHFKKCLTTVKNIQ